MNVASVTGKNWIKKTFNAEDVRYLKTDFFLDEIVAKLLAIRKIKKEDVKSFLDPSIKNLLPNPFLLKDMETTVKRTLEAINKKEKIIIFGDYDVDGAASTALLGNFFKALNQPFEIYIPDRKTEGYGPNIQTFKKIIDQGFKLIFTLDCGTLSFEPIKLAKKNNVDVIVLDHHQSDIKLPDAFSVVNPNRTDDNSKLNYLCAAGVVFMFLVGINKFLRDKNWFNDNSIKEPNLMNFLDLVSLGTVCDVVPLIGLNRALVKQGLKVLKYKNNLGLKTLLDICKIENNPNPYHLGFLLGPRINAGGRVGKCSHGVNLLLNTNAKETFKLASELDSYNKERQILEANLLNKILNTDYEDYKEPVIILSGNNWHEGVIGIIASRIKEKFNKPSIIISENNNIGKGSARSIVGFDIGTVIIAAVQNGILIKGGGHKMAGGFTIEMEKIDSFKEFVFKKYKSLNIDINEKKNYYYDSEISPTALNVNFFEKVNLLAPFGSGNLEPRFIIEKVNLISSKIVGEKHIKSILSGPDSTIIKTMAFNSVESDLSAYLLNKTRKFFNIAGKISLNEWKGQKNVEFIIDDISVSKKL